MAVATHPGTAAKSAKGGDAAAAAFVNEFTKAAKRKVEPFLDVSTTLGASAKNLAQADVPATGWLRHLVLTFTCDGNAAATLADDGPWSLIDSITFRDVNGQPLHTLSGFDLFVANLTGAYTQHADPRKLPGYSADPVAGIKFTLRVPVEIIARGALGCLANLNSAMTYKLAITLAPVGEVFASNAPAAPNVRVTGVVESWSNPAATDVLGQPNQTRPPAEGTTQNWSEHVAPVVVGQNTIRFPRVGNAIRNLVLIARDAAGKRTDGLYPDDLGLYFDGNQLLKCPTDYLRQRAVELYGYAPADFPAGVLVLPYTDDFDGTPGEEVGDFWMQTSGATRLELQGVAKTAGSLTILTNDVLAVAAPSGAGATLGAQAS